MQNLASRLSALYDGEPCNPSQAEIDQLVDFINAEFKRIPCPVIFVDHDIDLPDTMAHLCDHGVLLISTAHNHHPYLTCEQNARFRAIHDHHHAEIGADSTLGGEIKAFNHARKHAPKSIHWLLFSEIVLQAAACIHNGEFQPQKLVKAGGF
jgi:hypothetical protein